MANEPYPIPKFRFSVEFPVEGGNVKAGFTEVSGLDKETDIIEYREGTDETKYKRCVLGLNKANRVTLKRGIFNNDSRLQFYKWWNKTINKQTTLASQKEVTIKLMDEIGEPVVTWKLTKAIAIKMSSTDMKSDGNEIAIESIELTHEGLTIQEE